MMFQCATRPNFVLFLKQVTESGPKNLGRVCSLSFLLASPMVDALLQMRNPISENIEPVISRFLDFSRIFEYLHNLKVN